MIGLKPSLHHSWTQYYPPQYVISCLRISSRTAHTTLDRGVFSARQTAYRTGILVRVVKKANSLTGPTHHLDQNLARSTPVNRSGRPLLRQNPRPLFLLPATFVFWATFTQLTVLHFSEKLMQLAHPLCAPVEGVRLDAEMKVMFD